MSSRPSLTPPKDIRTMKRIISLSLLFLLMLACNPKPEQPKNDSLKTDSTAQVDSAKLKEMQNIISDPDMIVDSTALKLDTIFYVNGADAPDGTPEKAFDKYFWTMHDDNFKDARNYISRASWNDFDALVAEKRDKIRTNEKRDKSPGYEIMEKLPMQGFIMLKVLISPAGKDWVKRFGLIQEDNKWVVDFNFTKKAEVWGKVQLLTRAIDMNKDHLDDYSSVYSYPIDDINDLSDPNFMEKVKKEGKLQEPKQIPEKEQENKDNK
jgi:hypothetical protein